MALVDSSCSRSLASKDVLRRFVHVTTINGETNVCGVGVVNMGRNGGNPVKVDILVTRERLLGYDLLTGMNTIKEMGGVQITPPGTVRV